MKPNNKILQLLQKIGLTKGEAKLYLAANEYPKLTLKDLQNKTGYSTASTYRAFENLKGKGLLTSSPENWRKCIEAVSLGSLGEKLAKEQRKLRKIELELQGLDNLMNLSSRSEMEEPVEILYDKTQIIDKSFEILSRPLRNFWAFGSGETIIDILGAEPERNFVNIRKKKGKSCDLILTEMGEYGQELIDNNANALRNMKIKLDPNQSDHMTYIYEDEVTIWHKDKELGDRAIIIRDPVLVQMQENAFKSLWNEDK